MKHYDYEDLQDMMPLYVNGRLSAEDRAAFEKEIEAYPDLQREGEEFSEIKAAYNGIENDISVPSETLFARIEEAVEGQEQYAPLSEPGLWARCAGAVKTFFASPAVSWAVAGAQAIIIVFLIIYPVSQERMTTLSSGGESKNRINIVFTENAQEKQIRDLMIRAGTDIVDGPSPDGRYVLEPKAGRDGDAALEILRDAGIVRFSAKAY